MVVAAGRDSFHTYVEDYGDGSATLYYERVRCYGAADIFRVVDP